MPVFELRGHEYPIRRVKVGEVWKSGLYFQGYKTKLSGDCPSPHLFLHGFMVLFKALGQQV